MKSFRNYISEHPRVLRVSLSATLAAGALASMACMVDPGLVLGPGSNIRDWVQNAVSGSGVEQALFRLMTLPGGDVLYRRSPRETRPELTSLMQSNPSQSGLYALRAMEDERALDFNAAEQDWKTWAQKADDRAGANLDLANFYEKRLKPQEELSALAVVGQSPATQSERFSAPGDQRAWKAWEKSLTVVDAFALPRTVAVQIYGNWERRYPQERAVYQKELDYALAGKDFNAAAAIIDRYRRAIPSDREFPVIALANLETARSGESAGQAVYEKTFDPMWPASLIDGYMELLTANHGARKAADQFRTRLETHPEGGAEPLRDVARLYYLQQKIGQPDSAKQALTDYRKRKEARGASWSANELYTLGKLFEVAQDFPEASRYFYALASQKATPDDEERGLAGLSRILLTAPEQSLRLGAGNLAMYKNIATLDNGPGFWNGILSLWLNSKSPASEYASQDQQATPYFHRAKAAQIIADIDKRFPRATDRPELHELLIGAYQAYGEDSSVIREGQAYLSQFNGNGHRVRIALIIADVYSRTNHTDQEIGIYRDLLKELSAKMDGVPLGESGKRSVEYQQVLDRALARLVQLNKLQDALVLLRGELDRNPNDPGIYEKLATFLEQNQLNSHEEEVYQKAIAQFQQTGLVEGWYGKLARFYLRNLRTSDYRSLTRKVTGIFSGTELEQFLKDAPAPDSSLAYEVERYAHERFPHDLTFVNNLLAYHRSHRHSQELEKLLWEHWWENNELRNELFARLSANGRLDAQLEVLKKKAPEVDHGDWNGLAKSNPAAEHFWVESCLWKSHFEDGVAAAEALSAEYPADTEIGETASSLNRSLAYFQPEATDRAVAIEVRLLKAEPGNLDRMARVGDIYADRGRMSDAAPYWNRMAEVHPGDPNGYLQSATVYWDYFDFDSALTQLQKGREKLAKPALYSYEAGAIHETQGQIAEAIREYAAGSLASDSSVDSRLRFIELAGRPTFRATVDAQTQGLLKSGTPTQAAIELRIAVLDATHRSGEVATELREAISKADSFAVLNMLADTAQTRGLGEVQEAAVNRQIALSSDPIRKIELQYQLVDLMSSRDAAAATQQVDAIYHEHPKVLGVVRATVDYDWDHLRRQQAVSVLLEAAQSSYPDLKDKFVLEAGRKLTDLGDYGRAGKLLSELLARNVMDAGVETALANNYAHSGDKAGLEKFYKDRLLVVKSSALQGSEKADRIAQLRRGMIPAAEQLGEWDEVADQYIELINSFPGDADLVQEAALTAGAHNQGEKLTGFYRRTIQKSPQDARWSIVLGELETGLENFSAAVDAYGLAIHVRPEQKDLYSSHAELCERLHRLDVAVADYQTLYRLSYRDPMWKIKEAEARARQGRTADVVKALEEAWIQGHPANPGDQFRVAQQLEQWNMLDEARGYAERGADMAGPAWLVDANARQGAEVYARIMARLRHTDDGFARLAKARYQAEQLAVDTGSNSLPDPDSGINIDEWRNKLRAERRENIRNVFAVALKAIGTVVAQYDTPEEKLQFSTWLQGHMATASDGGELRSVYLPTIQAAGLKGLEVDLLWRFALASKTQDQSEAQQWLHLQRSRGQIDGGGKSLEDLAAKYQGEKRNGLLKEALQVYQDLNDRTGELRVLTALERGHSGGSLSARHFDLLFGARPNDLVARSKNDSVAQRLVESGRAELALSAIQVRSVGLPPVWKSAYTGLVGLYLHIHQPAIHQGFEDALATEMTIGDRLDHTPERNRQLAGDLWYYYGSRYGEYLDEEKDPRAEGLLEAALEKAPRDPAAYRELANFNAEAGHAEPALDDYRHSLALNHDQPAVLNSMAVLYAKRGDKKAAAECWKQAIQLLSAEMDSRRVPESFWDDFADSLEGASAHGSYSEISADVDNMLRVYLKRNGSYRSEPLLKAGYEANGQSLSWLLNLASQIREKDDFGYLLTALSQADWIKAEHKTAVLGHIVENLRSRSKPGEEAYELESAEIKWMNALLQDHQFAQARAELSRISPADLNKSGWVSIALQLADADKGLSQILDTWKKNPESAPETEELQTVALKLSDAGKRALLRYIYEGALDKRQLSTQNFLGLAGVNLDEGKNDVAVSLLKRLTLIGSNMYADTDAAAALLEKHGRFVEAKPFLQILTEALPWNAGYKVRMAVAQLAVDGHNTAALQSLQSVASDQKALYTDRITAAQAMRGRATGTTGSAELDLLSQSGCITSEEASKPFYLPARLAAAACSQSAVQRASLLRGALGDAPENMTVRMRFVQAALDASLPNLALLAAEPLLRSDAFGLTPSYSSEDYSNNEADSRKPEQLPLLKPEERSKMLWLFVKAHEKRGEDSDALWLLRLMLPDETDSKRSAAIQKEQDRIQADIDRAIENSARAPSIHKDLEQDHIVRPRLLPGMAFVPKKKAVNEEVAE